MPQNPCPQCSHQRPNLEATCAQCGWSPASVAVSTERTGAQANLTDEFSVTAAPSVPPLDPANPYAASAVTAEREGSLPDRAPLARVAIRWHIICAICCGPSFFLGATAASAGAWPMAIGVFLFACACTAIDHGTARSTLRQDHRLAWSLRLAYGIRVAISIVFPIGLYADMFCGLVTVTGCSLLLGGQRIALQTFPGVVLTTLMQGLVMNTLVLLLALFFYAIQWLANRG